MKKQILHGEKAREKLIAGVNAIAEAVVATLGPRSKNVGIGVAWGFPRVIHDGVNVARTITLMDPFENVAAQIVRQASEKTNESSGDGTTTSMLLTQQLINKGFEALYPKDKVLGQYIPNVMKFRLEVEEALKLVLDELKKMSKDITSIEERKFVASVSAQNEALGKLIAEASEKVGDMGFISVEESRTPGYHLEVVTGIAYDKGYISPYLTTNQRGTCELENVKILLIEGRLDEDSVLAELLSPIAKSNSILIVADGFSEKVTEFLVLNKLRGAIKVVATKPPGFGDQRRGFMEDIAVITGATIVDSTNPLEKATQEWLGQANRVVVERSHTVISGGGGEKDKIKERADSLTQQIKGSDSLFDKEKLEKRRASLTGGVAVIRVGAATETETDEQKLRVEDAIAATKAAMNGGILPGAGMALYRAREVLNNSDTLGSKILFEVLESPAKRILSNAGEEVDLTSLKDGEGFDVIKGQAVDLIKGGIIDPTEVVVDSLTNATSAALMVLTTDVLIVDEEKEEKKDGIL